ncbi:CAP domain-containing protein [Natronomonas sp. EA1]|uniref:CAP domain-containing protein n=1 Tax=Natronomonas sp. EA1 TaxID=3421655 RepID=UPI003EB9E5C4
MNKAFLIIVGVIMLTAMGVGALVGLQLGDGPAVDDPTETPVATDGRSSPGNGGGNGGGEATPTATATPTPTATATPVPPPERFDAAEIETAVREEINAQRADRGYRALASESTLNEMAAFHSDNMAAQGFVSHVADGFTTVERYQRFDVYDRCKLSDNSGTGIRDGKEIETVGKTVAGREYQENGETRINENEREVARAVVSAWFAEQSSRQKLLLQDADQAGVGATVTERGDVYVTVDLC